MYRSICMFLSVSFPFVFCIFLVYSLCYMGILPEIKMDWIVFNTIFDNLAVSYFLGSPCTAKHYALKYARWLVAFSKKTFCKGTIKSSDSPLKCIAQKAQRQLPIDVANHAKYWHRILFTAVYTFLRRYGIVVRRFFQASYKGKFANPKFWG